MMRQPLEEQKGVHSCTEAHNNCPWDRDSTAEQKDQDGQVRQIERGKQWHTFLQTHSSQNERI